MSGPNSLRVVSSDDISVEANRYMAMMSAFNENFQPNQHNPEFYAGVFEGREEHKHCIAMGRINLLRSAIDIDVTPYTTPVDQQTKLAAVLLSSLEEVAVYRAIPQVHVTLVNHGSIQFYQDRGYGIDFIYTSAKEGLVAKMSKQLIPG